jgi:hypothetical protein
MIYVYSTIYGYHIASFYTTQLGRAMRPGITDSPRQVVSIRRSYEPVVLLGCNAARNSTAR